MLADYNDFGERVNPDAPELPGVVVASINRNYPDVKLSEVNYIFIMRCWGFLKNGMFHGVEPDGHIHT